MIYNIPINNFFQNKRKKIIEFVESENNFIPLATKNIFLKYYSKNHGSIHKWTLKDADDYQKELEKCLTMDWIKGDKSNG